MGLLVRNLESKEEAKAPIYLTISEGSEELIMLPAPPRGLERFSLASRRPFREMYDAPFPNVVWVTGRQVGKSTGIGNRMLIRSVFIPMLHSLYVSPTHMQTAKFSNDRLRAPVHFSPDLQVLKGSDAQDAILAKKFRNGSEITLRYAFRSADRIRGIFTHNLYLDEYQDLVMDVIPVIEQCLYNAPAEIQSKLYAGTFKSTANPLTDLYYNRSNRLEWAVPCSRRCANGFTHWNILNVHNISRSGLICDRCKEPINANHPDCRWLSADINPEKEKQFVGFRLPQIALPCKWDEIWWNLRNHSTAQFYNDCLALPYDSGIRPLTLAQLQAVCNPDIVMGFNGPAGSRDYKFWQEACRLHGAYAGIDWGTGTGTGYSVLTIGTYGGTNRFTLFFHKRYEGIESDPEFVIDDALKLCRQFNVQLIGLDYGYGFGTNDRIIRNYGRDRAFKFEYVASNMKAVWDDVAGRYKIDRTEIMSDFYNTLKRGGTFELPRFEDFYDPFGKNYLAPFLEENRSLTKMSYNHSPSEPDDCVHSSIYCFLVACLHYKRPEFFWPVPLAKGQETVHMGM